ncbi:phosphoserine phosphatase SerB [Candidatus Aquiluna sp. UB-MaderosW2red]|uniref:phosphoserine phosphatase SerB n=1 Tax=Candidatus Aquiluna sp. UB-MaderosW2red TaxID=1855377 RepID=UPI000875B570|nr:phosphoserine phosphatase SerB [Candidatus Aquiluna sp. UB-MaderosW2red]SCX12191.1 phosphoserine phosphatase [Candidatus Aquiluna sp. UB-MaderosW2red]
MKKFLVVFDVDSTLIDQEAIELLADFAGSKDLVSNITERAMLGELDFSESLIQRVATLKNLDVSVLEQVSRTLTPTRGAKSLIEEIHNRGGKAAAVSGGFIQLLEPLKKELNLDFHLANRLEILDQKLTGRVIGNIIDREAKAEALIGWAAKLGIELQNTIAVGDGANDLGMMEVAGLSVAFCAKPVVREFAKVTLDERDLALLIPYLP